MPDFDSISRQSPAPLLSPSGYRITSPLGTSRSHNDDGLQTTTALGSETERARLCGSLFNRRSSINQELLDEFFRREPCHYDQEIYKKAARIFNCLKADLNENPILKSLKQQQQKERGEQQDMKVTDIPKIQYRSDLEKKNTLQLAFLTLKFQKVLEELIDNCQLYDSYSDLKDESSLTCTILFDYMMRKFQVRAGLVEEPLDNRDQVVSLIENTIVTEKTNLAAELAKNRIKADALTLDDLLPKDLREVDQHRAELPLYCWVNQLKITVPEMVQILADEENLKQVEVKRVLDKRCFMIDPHCPNVIMFHYSLRDKIITSEHVRSARLVVQDKSSCLAPHTVVKLLTKKDDVLVTNLSGGLVAAFIGSMMSDYEGKVMVFGAASEEKYQEINAKYQQIGCSKYVKLMREDFVDVRYDDARLENVKVVLVNPPCSKSALMNPMEFLFQEGEDVRYLRDYTLDVNNPNKVKKCIEAESSMLRHAVRIPKIRAIVYQTYSKNSSENEKMISQSLEEYNEHRKSINALPYKISPPVIPLTAEDIKNNEVVKDIKFLQFKPSNKMNGCFIALLTRDRELSEKEARRLQQQKSKAANKNVNHTATFEEKNFLRANTADNIKVNKKQLTATNQAASMKRLTTLRRKSLGPTSTTTTNSTSSSKRPSKVATSGGGDNYDTLEQEIKQLQLKTQLDLPQMQQQHHQMLQERKQSIASINQIELNDERQQQQPGLVSKSNSLQSRLASIGKLDSNKSLILNRSSTPDEQAGLNEQRGNTNLDGFQFKLEKTQLRMSHADVEDLNQMKESLVSGKSVKFKDLSDHQQRPMSSGVHLATSSIRLGNNKRQQDFPSITKRAKSASVSNNNKNHSDIVLVELLTPRASSISLRSPLSASSSQIGDNYKTNMLKLMTAAVDNSMFNEELTNNNHSTDRSVEMNNQHDSFRAPDSVDKKWPTRQVGGSFMMRKASSSTALQTPSRAKSDSLPSATRYTFSEFKLDLKRNSMMTTTVFPRTAYESRRNLQTSLANRPDINKSFYQPRSMPRKTRNLDELKDSMDYLKTAYTVN